MKKINILIIILLLTSFFSSIPTTSQAQVNNPPIRLKGFTFRPGRGELPNISSELRTSQPGAGRYGYYIVQFNGPIQAHWRTALESTGAQIEEYIPEFAYKVRMTREMSLQVRSFQEVSWMGLFEPAYKISPNLDGENLLRVNLTTRGKPELISRQIEALNGKVVDISGNTLTVELASASIPALARINEVAWIQPEPTHILFNNIARGGGGGMDAYAMWNLGVYGAGQIAAVADSGLDTNNPDTVHNDFQGRVVAVEMVGDLETDEVGHGTHVAGSIIGNGTLSGSNPAAHDYGQYDPTDQNQSTGIVTGIAPEASLYFQVNACRGWFGSINLCLPSDLNTLFQPAYNAGARVHSNSWGDEVAGDYDSDSQDVDQFTWNNKDMLITTSAGNAGIDANNNGYTDLDSMGSPGTAKNVLTVGASENARTNGGINPEDNTNDLDEFRCPDQYNPDISGYTYAECNPTSFDAAPTGTDRAGGNNNFGEMAAWSSRGPTDDGRIKPDLVAPGTNILSTKSNSSGVCYVGPGPDNNYCMNSGTSMSNPLTAGAAILVRDWYDTIKGYANPSGALVKATLINTAVDINGYGISGQEAALPIPNNHEGWGRVNLANVASDGREFFDGDSVATGGLMSYQFTVPGGAPLKASLVWSDYPASTSASVSLVNDLDLVLIGPDGTYYGNVFSGGWSAAGGSLDRINNVENIYLANPTPGTWTVEVRGYNVPYAPQPYALVVDGGTLGGDTPPTVSVSDPSEGQEVNGIYLVQVDASDDSNVDNVMLSINGEEHIDITGSFDGSHYSYNWDTTTELDGTSSLQARATDDANQSTDSTVVNVTVDNVNDPPAASFTFTCSDLNCDFDASGSYDPDGSITSYDWIFGDGDTGNGLTVSHSYSGYGEYNVVLTVTDDGGETGTDTQIVSLSQQATASHIGNLEGSSTIVKNKWTATIEVQVHDNLETPVANATVTGNFTSGTTGSEACTTASNGLCLIEKDGIRAGIEQVEFTITDITHSSLVYNSAANHDLDGDSDGTSITVYQYGPPPNQPPMAAFTYSCTELTCDFDASGSSDTDGTIVNYDWVFGDGGTGNNVVTSHTYSTDGTYTVALTVTDNGGASDTVTQDVILGNQSPVAVFTYSCADLTCDFDAGGSNDPDGSISTYDWDFGDEGNDSGVTTNHTYATTSTYTVVLTVTDNEGATDIDTQSVTVSSSGGLIIYVSDITMSDSSGGPNLRASASITILDTDGNPVSGASVYGSWSGDYSASVTGVTGADGSVTFTSGKVRQAGAIFTFTVDDVVLDGYSYDPILNNETSDTISIQ